MATMFTDTNSNFHPILLLEDLAVMAIAAFMLRMNDVKAQLWELLSNYDNIITKQKEKTFPEMLNQIASHSTVLLNKMTSLGLPELLNLKLVSVTKDYNFQIVLYLNQRNFGRIVTKFDFETVTKCLDGIKWTQNGLISKIDSLPLLAGVKANELAGMSKDKKIEKYYNYMCGTNELIKSYWHSCCIEKNPGNFKIKRKIMSEVEEKLSEPAKEFIKNAKQDKSKFIVTMSVLMLEPIAAEYFLRNFVTSVYILDLFNLFVSEMQQVPKKIFGKIDNIDRKSEESYNLVNILWLLFSELNEEEKLEAFKRNQLFILKKLSLLWQWQRFVVPLIKIYQFLISETVLLDLFEDILKNAAYEPWYLQHFLNIWHSMPVCQKEKFVKHIINDDDGDQFWSHVDLKLSKVLFNSAALKKILQENTNLIMERLLRFGRFDVVDYWLKEIGLDSGEINKIKRNIFLERRVKCLTSLLSSAEKGGEFLVNHFLHWGFGSNSEITKEEALKIKEDVGKSFGVKICVVFIKNLDQDGLNKFLDWAFGHTGNDEKFQAPLWKLKEEVMKTLAEGKVLKWNSKNCGQILKNFILWRTSGDVETKIWEFQKLFINSSEIINQCCEWCKTEKEEPFKHLIDFIFIFDKRNSPDFNKTVWQFLEKVISGTIRNFSGAGGFPGEKCRKMFGHLINSATDLEKGTKAKIKKLKKKLIEDEDTKLILSYDINDEKPKALDSFYRFFFDSEDGINLNKSVLRETKESVVEEMMEYAMTKEHQMPHYCATGMEKFFLLGISDDEKKIWEMKKWFLDNHGKDVVFKWIDFHETSEMYENLSWLIDGGENEEEAKKALFTLKQEGLELLWMYKKYIDNKNCLKFCKHFFMWTCFGDEELKREVLRLRDELMGSDPDDKTPRVKKAANFLTKCLENKFGKNVEDPSIYKYYEIKVGEKDLTDSEDDSQHFSEDEFSFGFGGGGGGDDSIFSDLINFLIASRRNGGEDESDDEDGSDDEDEDEDGSEDEEEDYFDDEDDEDDEDDMDDDEDDFEEDDDDDEDEDL